MKTPKKIKNPGVKDLDVENNLGTTEPKGSKNLIDDEDFDDDLDELADLDDLSGFDDSDDEDDEF